MISTNLQTPTSSASPIDAAPPIDLYATIVRNPPVVAAETTVMAAIAIMGEEVTGCVLVMAENRLLGLFTEWDVLRLSAQSAALDQLPLQAVVRQPAIAVQESDVNNISRVISLFRQHQVRYLPVVDGDDRVVGMLTQDAVTEILAQQVLSPRAVQPTIADLPAEPAQTEPAQAELESDLSRSPIALQHLFASMEDYIFVLNHEGRYLQAARTNPDSAGKVNRTLHEVLPAAIADRFLATIREVLASQKSARMEYGMFLHGKERWFSTIVSPLNADAVLWVARDISDRKQVETALIQQEEQSRAILSAIPDLMFRVGADGRYRGYLTSHTLFDVIPQAVNPVGQHVREMLPAGMAQRQEHYLQQALQTGEMQVYEQRIQIGDRWQDEEVRVVPCGDEEVLFMIRDISDRKAAELKLHRYEQVVLTTTDGIALVDRNYIYQLVNQVYLDRFQKQRDEIIGHSVQELHDEAIFQTLIQPYLDQCLTGVAQDYEAWFDYPYGRRFIKVIYDPYVEPDGTITGVVVTTQDLTALKQTEAALQENEQFLRSIYEGVEQPIFTIDVLENGEFCHIAFNPAAERVSGTSTTEVFGKAPGEKVRQRYRECVQAGMPITYEECLIFRGQNTWWLTTLNPLRDDSSRIYRLVGTSVEITQRKQAEILLALHNTILEKVANADPLPDILDTLLRAMESQLVDAHCSIMFCENDGTLRHGIAPNLPAAYLQAIDGVAIGEGVGCCGTAALRQETVIVTDIATDPLWQDYCHLALEHGLCACWSVPIVASNGFTLGVFGVYYRESRAPQPQELERVMQSVYLAGIAIERHQATHALLQMTQGLERLVEERTVALQKSEQRYRALMEGASDAILLADTQGNLISGNQQATVLLGYSLEELTGLHISQIHPPEVWAGVQNHFASLVQGVLGTTHETVVLRKDDSQAPVGITGSRIELDNQVIIQGIFRDISDRKRVEQENQHLKERLQFVLSSSPAVIFTCKPDGDYGATFISDNITDMTGYTPTEFLAVSSFWADHLHPDDAPQVFAHLSLLFTQGRHIHEYRFRHRAGHYLWVRDELRLVRNAQGTPIEIVGYFADISDRKQTETALRLSETRFRRAFDNAPVGMCLISPDGQFLKVNPAFCAFLDYEDDELLELRFQNVVHPNDLATNLTVMERMLAGQIQSYSLEERYFTKSGDLVWGAVSISLVRDTQEQPLYFVAQVQDISDRKQAELALQASELKFRRMFDSSVVGMIFADFKGQILDANDRFLQMVGYTRADLEAGIIRWDAMTPPDYISADFAAMERLKKQGAIDPLEKEYIRKDGSRVPVLMGAAILPGSTDQTICVVVDISDRKRTEVALQESQRFIQQIADSSPNILYLYDVQEQRNVYANREITTILGYTPEKIQAMGTGFIQALMHPDDRQHILPDWYDRINAAQNGDIIETEYRLRHANGEWRWLYSWDAVFNRDAQGRVKQVIGTAKDITERKELELEQNRLIAILEASTDYISMVDAHGTILWKNAELKRLCGTTQDNDLLHYQIADCHPAWARDVVMQQGIPAAIAMGSWVGETAVLDVNKEEVPVSQLILAHRSLHGEIEFFSFIMRDIRDQKNYEQRLEQTNAELLRVTRLKDDFLANMSHELRTPLNAILGMSEGLQDDVFGTINDRQKTAIATIERSGQHLLALINDILEVSKISAGKLELEITPVSVTDLCSSSLMFVKQQAFKKQIQLRTIAPPNLGIILIDERRMRQVLINLLTNAVKFTPTEGKVTLEVHLEPTELNLAERVPTVRSTVPPEGSPPAEAAYCQYQDYLLCISVIDTGIGIAAADQAKLFQPFVQLDSSLNRQYEGTGLGLTLVKQIVELHGGSVSLRSSPGHGSCFTVHIPYRPTHNTTTMNLAEQDSAPPVEIASSSPAGAVSEATSQTTPNVTVEYNAALPVILLVEDNEANISTISCYLTAKHYQIMVARNGQEAIDLAQAHQPDLILMDIQMPGVDGLEAIRRIRLDANLTETPIVALTALVMPADRQRCLDAGATEYLAKPIKLKALSQMIQTLLPA